MLARRLTAILPAMRLAEALETTRLPRVTGLTGAQFTEPGQRERVLGVALDGLRRPVEQR